MQRYLALIGASVVVGALLGFAAVQMRDSDFLGITVGGAVAVMLSLPGSAKAIFDVIGSAYELRNKRVQHDVLRIEKDIKSAERARLQSELAILEAQQRLVQLPSDRDFYTRLKAELGIEIRDLDRRPSSLRTVQRTLPEKAFVQDAATENDVR